MKNKVEISDEYWSAKLMEIQKNCTLKRDYSIDERLLDIDKIAEELLRSLREEISDEYVKVEDKKKYADKDVHGLRAAVQFEDGVSLEFTSFIGWQKSDARNRMLLRFSKAWHSFDVDIRDYKTIVEEFILFYKNYKLYCEELSLLLHEYEKQEKIRQTAMATIQTVVSTFMAQTGYEWNLVKEDDRAILQVKMKRAKMIEITLGYKTFSNKIPELMNVIKQMDELISTIPYPANIKSYGRNIAWKRK